MAFVLRLRRGFRHGGGKLWLLHPCGPLGAQQRRKPAGSGKKLLGGFRHLHLLLVRDLSDPALTDALKRYFDKTSPMSKRVKYCAAALVGFDAAFYPGDQVQAIANKMAEAARSELKKWCETIGAHLKKEKLEQIEIELFCLPLPSAEDFRSAFLKAMGQTV